MGSASRYNELPTGTVEVVGDDLQTKTVRYFRRRPMPAPESFDVVAVHETTIHDRLDRITSEYLGDPEAFWMVADANRALWPDDLTARTEQDLILIPLPKL